MRFFRDDLGVTIPVEWYEVPEDRPMLGLPTLFGSRDHQSQRDPFLLGEVPGTKQYVNSQHADDRTGEGLCGTPEQWRIGPSITDTPAKRDPDSGIPCCCGRPPKFAGGAVVIGSEVEVSHFPIAYNVDFGDAGDAVWEPFWGQSCCDAISGLWTLAFINFVETGVWVYRDFFSCPQQDRQLQLLFFGPAVGDLIRLQMFLPGTPVNPLLYNAVLSETDITKPFQLLLQPPILENALCENFPPLSVTMVPVYE